MNLLRVATAAWAFIICLVIGVTVGVSYSGRTTGPSGMHPSSEAVLGTAALLNSLVPAIAVGVVISAVIALPGWLLYRVYMRLRPAKKPRQLALEDPWVRSKLAGMTEQERAEFFQKIEQ